ncbi:unnamed protein product [Closterium sp. Naga37s-1]|nr:unnamed protein product [Closterium sp. Naga37s-1]
MKEGEGTGEWGEEEGGGEGDEEGADESSSPHKPLWLRKLEEKDAQALTLQQNGGKGVGEGKGGARGKGGRRDGGEGGKGGGKGGGEGGELRIVAGRMVRKISKYDMLLKMLAEVARKEQQAKWAVAEWKRLGNPWPPVMARPDLLARNELPVRCEWVQGVVHGEQAAIVVLFVHRHVEYLEVPLDALSRVQGINETLLIVRGAQGCTAVHRHAEYLKVALGALSSLARKAPHCQQLTLSSLQSPSVASSRSTSPFPPNSPFLFLDTPIPSLSFPHFVRSITSCRVKQIYFPIAPPPTALSSPILCPSLPASNSHDGYFPAVDSLVGSVTFCAPILPIVPIPPHCAHPSPLCPSLPIVPIPPHCAHPSPLRPSLPPSNSHHSYFPAVDALVRSPLVIYFPLSLHLQNGSFPPSPPLLRPLPPPPLSTATMGTSQQSTRTSVESSSAVSSRSPSPLPTPPQLLIPALSSPSAPIFPSLFNSHDGFFPAVDALIRSITFCCVKQIYFPLSLHLQNGSFPNRSPLDCPPSSSFKGRRDGQHEEEGQRKGQKNGQETGQGKGQENGQKEGLENGQEEGQQEERKEEGACFGDVDQNGRYRDPHFMALKNTVWDGLSETNTFTGHMLFIEEDHLLFPNALAHLKSLIRVKNARCPECVAVTLAPSNVKSRGESGLRAFVRERMGNVGYAFNRSVWKQIHKSHKYFCYFDDYNWDVSLSESIFHYWRHSAQTPSFMSPFLCPFSPSPSPPPAHEQYFCYFDDYNWDVSLSESIFHYWRQSSSLRWSAASAHHFGRCGLHSEKPEAPAHYLVRKNKTKSELGEEHVLDADARVNPRGRLDSHGVVRTAAAIAMDRRTVIPVKTTGVNGSQDRPSHLAARMNEENQKKSSSRHDRRRSSRDRRSDKKGKSKRRSSDKKGSKSSGEATPGPVQLSQFLGRDDGSTRYSVISGKKIRMKVDKTKDDKVAEANRSELLRFLNSSYD